MAYDFAKLVAYRKAIRPPSPESFPSFVDTELDKAARSTAEVVQAITDLNDRLVAAGL